MNDLIKFLEQESMCGNRSQYDDEVWVERRGMVAEKEYRITYGRLRGLIEILKSNADVIV